MAPATVPVPTAKSVPAPPPGAPAGSAGGTATRVPAGSAGRTPPGSAGRPPAGSAGATDTLARSGPPATTTSAGAPGAVAPTATEGPNAPAPGAVAPTAAAGPNATLGPPDVAASTVPRALIASDSAILLAGIRVALATEEWPIAGATRSLSALRTQADRCRADVLVVAPSTSPTPELREEVAAASRNTVVLLWGAGVRVHGHEPLGDQRCIYLSFEAAPSLLTDALREVDADDVVGARTTTTIVGESGMLSAREGEVLAAVATGASNPEVAERLFVTQETVKSHLRRIYAKLGVCSRSEAVAFYYGHCSAGPERAEPLVHRAA